MIEKLWLVEFLHNNTWVGAKLRDAYFYTEEGAQAVADALRETSWISGVRVRYLG